MKTLVEQLRDIVEESRKGGAFPTWYAAGFITNCSYNSDIEYERELFTAIADRIEREYMPLPLDADGVPIIVGDVVYFVDNAEAFDVLGIESDGDEPVHIGRKDETSTNAWVSPGDLTHKQPDTIERIEADAMKVFSNYWGCGEAECRCCPSMVDGKKPYERYATEGCGAAQRIDLLQRQRKVLERGQE